MTKMFAGASIMMLVDEGKISLDDPVERYLPEFKGQMLTVERDAEHARHRGAAGAEQLQQGRELHGAPESRSGDAFRRPALERHDAALLQPQGIGHLLDGRKPAAFDYDVSAMESLGKVSSERERRADGHPADDPVQVGSRVDDAPADALLDHAERRAGQHRPVRQDAEERAAEAASGIEIVQDQKILAGIGREFMPPLDEGVLLYMPTTMPGASISATISGMWLSASIDCAARKLVATAKVTTDTEP